MIASIAALLPSGQPQQLIPKTNFYYQFNLCGDFFHKEPNIKL